MRIEVDSLNCRLLPRLTAPPIRIVDEEELFLGEEIQTREVLIGFLVGANFPCLKRGRETACIGDILAKREPAIDVKGFVIRSRDAEVRVLLDEALSVGFECRNGLVGPPVGVIAVLIVVATGTVEGVGEFVAGDAAEGAVGEILRDGDVKDRELHYSGREDYFVAWWVAGPLSEIGVCERVGGNELISVDRRD
jgi:hypothetical protein